VRAGLSERITTGEPAQACVVGQVEIR